MASAETSRAGPAPWAGRAAGVRLPTEARGARRLGVVCLASTRQMPRGQRVRVAPMSQQRRAHGTVPGRSRWCWGGQRLFTNPGDAWSAWRPQPWERLRPLVPTPSAAPVSETASPSALEEGAGYKDGHSPGASPSPNTLVTTKPMRARRSRPSYRTWSWQAVLSPWTRS